MPFVSFHMPAVILSCLKRFTEIFPKKKLTKGNQYIKMIGNTQNGRSSFQGHVRECAAGESTWMADAAGRPGVDSLKKQ